MADLIPFALGAGIVPAVVAVTLLLVRSPHGPITAVAWLAGMVSTRLMQGALFGWVVPAQATVGRTGRSTIVATVLLVLSILMFGTAAEKALGGGEEEEEEEEEEEAQAAPPKWMSMIRSVTPTRAFVYGALLILVSAKQWVFTLGAIGAIGASPVRGLAAIVTYVVFVAVVVSPSLAIAVAAYAFPDRSSSGLEAITAWLRAHDDTIAIALSLVFGTVFGVKALLDFGVL
ncbi:MAG TPA: GAP family protein [Euzebyales bacterium]